jgi:quinolinate synthase
MNQTVSAAKIQEEKAKSGTLIVAHTYQPPEILALADVIETVSRCPLPRQKPTERVLSAACGLCGTVKNLSPQKEVILARRTPDARWPNKSPRASGAV